MNENQLVLQEEDQENYGEECYENTELKCPECGSYMRSYYRSNGPDDYCKELVCPGCGSTESE